jgi:N-acyl-D-aspartate/D-glutamate deacylase
MDTVIRNGLVIDGSGSAKVRADVGIEGDRIVAVGRITERGKIELDASGAVVCPGFIDVHTHFDAQVLWDPMLSPSVYHGVTTVLSGNCGFTLAPLSGKTEDADYLVRMLSRVEGMPLATLQAAVKPTWRTFGEYLDRLDGRLAINTAFLVGHSALRRTAMGERALTDKATSADIERMVTLLRQSLADGGVGFSTTIAQTHSDNEGRPVPSRVADREEIVTLASVVGDFPGTWLEIVFGVVVMQEEHYALAADMSVRGRRPLNWNAVQIDSSRPDLVDNKVRASDYVRERGGTLFGLIPAAPMTTLLNFVNCFVIDTLPGWSALVPLSLAERRKALADPTFRAMLKDGAARAAHLPETRMRNWPAVVLEALGLPQNARWNGRPLGEYAAAIGKDPLDALFDLAVEENLGVSFSRAAESTDEASWQIRAALWRDPRLLIGGSDAGAHLDMLDSFAFSTQLLGEAVRRRGLLTLEDAVHRITGLPAKRFGLTGRGRIGPGAAADIVILDPERVDRGPVSMRQDLPGGEKRLYADAVGVRQVMVGGVVVAEDNRPTGRLGGRVLRSGRDTHTVPVGLEAA